MPFNPFKGAAQKADDEFKKAYDKGVNLGPQGWRDAVDSFSQAAKEYTQAGNAEKAAQASALALLFLALSTKDVADWDRCSQSMKGIPETQLDLGGFSASSSQVGLQSQILCEDMGITTTGVASDLSRVAGLRELAQKYMALSGGDLVVWKLLKEEIDPEKRAYYLLGVASMVEGNALMDRDPQKGVALLSEAATDMDLAGIDPLNIKGETQAKRDNATKVARCWFCGREAQGLDYNYFALPADVTDYFRDRYGSGIPPILEGQSVLACRSCYSSVRNAADAVAQHYYEMAMTELRESVQRLNSRMDELQSRVETALRR